MTKTRTETDTFGPIDVATDRYWGAQTQRSLGNFRIGWEKQPLPVVRALGIVKRAAAETNVELGRLDPALGDAIVAAAQEVIDGKLDDHFPLVVWQTGSGTQSNMNANEVIANRAIEMLGGTMGSKDPVHPNDHVNRGQSSNDVFPTAMHIAAAEEIARRLDPALSHLFAALKDKSEAFDHIIKIGRTHTQDATPLTLGQEFSGYAAQVDNGIKRMKQSLYGLYELAQGGTAVGTGINAHPDFAARFAAHMSQRTGLAFRPAEDQFERLSTQDTAVELSGQLKVVAVSCMKIANDLRWMNSGPLAGLAEITLPALQPGSSIMPGKINPVIPEAVCMLSAQVIGNDATVTVGGQAGNFELNVMLPVIAYNLLQSIELLANGGTALADSAIAGFTVNEERLKEALDRNPILVTALNPVIGYEKGAAIAKKAYAEGRPIREVAREETDLSDEDLDRLLDPTELTRGGIKG
jgi:fumarate hydratase, class II